jgi:anti-sigma factor RsiW
MTDPRHLTEAERHGAADGTLAPELTTGVAEHLGACDDCAADVARIKTLMTRTRDVPSWLTEGGDDLWPAIRARIEQEKVASLHDRAFATSADRRRVLWTASVAAAAGLIIVAALLRRGAPIDVAPAGGAAFAANIQAVAESTHVYEEQAKFLLNQLELRRALMRPQTAASIDHDLEVIDNAIAELKRAIARDPNNAALRALLASSYKQKVDLLKRVGNAG